MSSTSIPAYVAEAAPPNIRGRLVTLYQLFITMGFLIAGVLAGAFNYLPGWFSWRLMFGAAAIPGIIQSVGFFFMPESPRWLATHGKEKEAAEVLARVCSTKEIANWELRAITRSYREAKAELEETGNRYPLVTLLKTPHLRRALIVGCSLQALQQLSGINTVMYYSVSIIQMAGVDNVKLSVWLGTLVTGFNFLCTFIGLYLVDKIGRRKLLLGSMAGCAVCLLILSIGFKLIDDNAPSGQSDIDRNGFCNISSRWTNESTDIFVCAKCEYVQGCGFCYRIGDASNASTVGVCLQLNRTYSENGTYSVDGSACDSQRNEKYFHFAKEFCPSDLVWLPLLGMMLYICSFASGLGPMVWTINAEIFPHFVRSTGCAVATFFNWTFNLLISLTFLTLTNSITKQGAFLLYSAITTAGLVICYLIVPETRNKELEEMQHLFRRPFCSYRTSKTTE